MIIDNYQGRALADGIPSSNYLTTLAFTTTTAKAVASTDVSFYRGICVHIISQGASSTVTFQGSNDNTNWVSIALTISTSVTTAPVVSTTTTGAYYGPLHFKYFRLNVTGITSGTTAGVIAFSTIYSQANPITAVFGGAVTVAAGSTTIAKAEDSVSANANVGVPPLVVRADATQANAGVSNDGDYAFMFCDVNGRLYTNSLMVGKTGDATYQTPRLNPQTHALNFIDYAHNEIHSGDHFFVQINKDVANGGTYAVAFTTPNTTKWLHMLCQIDVELEAEIILYEGVTSWTGGTAITPRNNDRNSATTSGVTDMVFDPTVTLGSPIILCTKVLGSGKDFGAMNRAENELILKQGTKYYILITNQATGASNEVNIDLEYYEHTNRSA